MDWRRGRPARPQSRPPGQHVGGGDGRAMERLERASRAAFWSAGHERRAEIKGGKEGPLFSSFGCT